jgi:hypothetical protein
MTHVVVTFLKPDGSVRRLHVIVSSMPCGRTEAEKGNFRAKVQSKKKDVLALLTVLLIESKKRIV